MHSFRLVLILGLLACVLSPVYASEETVPEAQPACDPETDESCASEEGEEELERGFDPCLINSALPACKPDGRREESRAAEGTPSQAGEPDDSG